ncbi:chromosome partitioning protein, ParB family [Caldanaerobius fijiensis DSM 17918]|uniref:Chromosome partitioning protein, ParB family n=1 Tax=Caldanaerobius fijiensis DSM 17918 TaxID=1121256 RepID=A0A1M5E9H4_9THEO|nr:ParB/RepB/Spo0J family partition protein [Caldanaerobius fijiensis]SHF75898.1 chromosome partitioning protein, ParB family [Caldanaerobius fijiensis DSM 17918]
MELINVELLKEHPRNSEFFDDITGKRWDEFLESIRTSGIIVPLVITQDYVVVSGNQRLRAAKKLNMKEVPCEIREYQDRDGMSKEDLILKDLIETNLRQRGIGNLNPMKTARCILELERIYGVKRGRPNNVSNGTEKQEAVSPFSKTQTELAEDIGITERRLKQLKKLNDLIPELQKLVEEGKLSSTAGEQLAYLDEETQRQLFNVLGEDLNDQAKRIRQEAEKNMQRLAEQLNQIQTEKRRKEAEIAKMKEELNSKETLIGQYEAKIRMLEQRMKDLESGEAVPEAAQAEMEELERKQAELQEELERARKEAEHMRSSIKQKEEAFKSLKLEFDALKSNIETQHGATPLNFLDINDFSYNVSRFLEKVSPLVYLGEQFTQLNDSERSKWLEKISAVETWVNGMKEALKGEKKGLNVTYQEVAKNE